jgi:hypothetical protein
MHGRVCVLLPVLDKGVYEPLVQNWRHILKYNMRQNPGYDYAYMPGIFFRVLPENFEGFGG